MEKVTGPVNRTGPIEIDDVRLPLNPLDGSEQRAAGPRKSSVALRYGFPDNQLKFLT